jgi:chromosome segregation ATPase
MGRNDPPAFAAFLKLRRPMAAFVALSLGMGVASITTKQVLAQNAEQQAEGEAGPNGDNALDQLTTAIGNYKTKLQKIKDALEKSPEPSELTRELGNSKDLIEDLTKRLTLVRDERDVLAAELAGERETSASTIASMKLDSERDRALMAQIQTELGQTKGELEDTVNARVALEALLTEQQATADELEQQMRSEIDVNQQQLTGLQSVRDELQAELVGVRETSSAEIESLNGDIDAANAQIEALTGQLATTQEQYAAVDTSRETISGELEAVKQAAAAQSAELTGQIEAATSRADSLSDRLNVSQQQAIELQEAQQLLESELAKLTNASQTQTADLRKQLELARQEISDREASYDDLSKQMADATAAAANQSAQLATELEAAQVQLAELQQSNALVESDYAEFRSRANAEKESLEANLNQSSTQVVKLEATRDGLLGQISEAAVTAERCVADVAELGDQLIAALDHLEQLEAALAQAQAGRSALAAELAAVRRENGETPGEETASDTTQ